MPSIFAVASFRKVRRKRVIYIIVVSSIKIITKYTKKRNTQNAVVLNKLEIRISMFLVTFATSKFLSMVLPRSRISK